MGELEKVWVDKVNGGSWMRFRDWNGELVLEGPFSTFDKAEAAFDHRRNEVRAYNDSKALAGEEDDSVTFDFNAEVNWGGEAIGLPSGDKE